MITNNKPCLMGEHLNTSWEYYLSDTIPDRALCASVIASVKYNNDFVLTKNNRGWDLPGGHLEKGETIEEALEREVLEEAGAYFYKSKLIGYILFRNKASSINRCTGEPYPFPIGYAPHFLVETDKLIKPTGDKNEIFDAKVFSFKELEILEGMNDISRKIIMFHLDGIKNK